MDTDRKAALYDFVKNYLEGAAKLQQSSDFGRGNLLDRQTWGRVTWTGCN